MDWQTYLQFASGRSLDDSMLELRELEDILDVNQRIFSSYFHHSIPVVYLLDYTTGKYLTMSKAMINILGEQADTFIQNGINLLPEIYHREDMKLFNDSIFPDRLDLLRNYPTEEHRNFVFTYGYRLRNKWGSYTNLLQRNWFVKSDEQGNPLMSMGIVLNVDGLISPAPAVQTVVRIAEGKDSPMCYQTVFKKQYSLGESDRLFSRREIEVLKWMSEGLTSKEIADKMFVSEHTIITHRRNMHEKTGISNATALVTYGFRERYL